MIVIFNQDRGEIVNCNNIEACDHIIVSEDTDMILGSYETEQRVEEVMAEIWNEIKFGKTNSAGQLFYSMPIA